MGVGIWFNAWGLIGGELAPMGYVEVVGRGLPAEGGGVGLAAVVGTESRLDNSLAWLSPKLRVSDLLRSVAATWGGRLMCPVL